MALPRRTLVVPLFACCLALGCGGSEPITSYSVPRSAEPKRITYRILGAVYPENNPVWYFKFTGTQDELTKHEADWEKLITSVKVKDGAAVPEFTLPAGWINIGERVVTRGGIENRTDAVLKIGSKDSPLEVTVNRNDGGLVPNLDRWAFLQLDAEYDKDKLASMAEPFAAAGGKGLRVDFRGPKNPSGGGPMMKR